MIGNYFPARLTVTLLHIMAVLSVNVRNCTPAPTSKAQLACAVIETQKRADERTETYAAAFLATEAGAPFRRINL